MKIVFPAGPAGAIECVTSFLLETLHHGVFDKYSAACQMEPMDRAQARITSLFPAHHIYREHVQNVQAISDAGFLSWQCLILSGNSPITDLGLIEKDGKLIVSHMTGDSVLAKSAVEAIRLAEESVDTDELEYEFRLLRAPCVDFTGVWLHNQNADAVIPVGRKTTSGLSMRKLYRGEEILDRLKSEHAARKL